MKWIATVVLSLCLGSASFAKPPVPRPSPEFTITDSSGKPALLTSHRGKVVLVQFLYTTCAHCQATARMLSKLQTEFASRGLDVVGVAFNSEAQASGADFMKANGLTFPVGFAPSESVLSYLGISVVERFVVPQIVIIDRNGVIREQSDANGSPQLQDESQLRSLLDALLKESRRTSQSTSR